jgi:hypothetical protein
MVLELSDLARELIENYDADSVIDDVPTDNSCREEIELLKKKIEELTEKISKLEQMTRFVNEEYLWKQTAIDTFISRHLDLTQNKADYVLVNKMNDLLIKFFAKNNYTINQHDCKNLLFGYDKDFFGASYKCQNGLRFYRYIKLKPEFQEKDK